MLQKALVISLQVITLSEEQNKVESSRHKSWGGNNLYFSIHYHYYILCNPKSEMMSWKADIGNSVSQCINTWNKSWQVSHLCLWPFVRITQLTSKWWYNTESQWICFSVGRCAVWKFLRKTILLTWGFLFWHWKKTCNEFIGSNFESLADFSNWEVTAPTTKWEHVSAPQLHQQEISGLTSPVAVGWC